MMAAIDQLLLAIIGSWLFVLIFFTIAPRFQMWPNLAMLWEILVDIYGCMVALLRKSQGQVEALLVDRTRLEAFVKIQHEFWLPASFLPSF